MKIHHLAPDLDLIDVQPPIPGWSDFIGVYVLRGQELALADVGPAASMGNLIQGLESLGVHPGDVAYILLSHIHLDHAGALGKALELFPRAVVVVHPKGAPHLIDVEKLWEGSLKTLGEVAEKQGRPQNIARDRIIEAADGFHISLGNGFEIEAIHTPGHSAHHLSFLNVNNGDLFVGEAGGVYASSIDYLRPTTPPPLILEHELASIDKLLERDLRTIYHGHFGSGGDAKRQLERHREQLKLWERILRVALQKGSDAEAIAAALVALDPLLSNIEKLPPDQYERERYFMNNSIRGFTEYLTARGVTRTTV